MLVWVESHNVLEVGSIRQKGVLGPLTGVNKTPDSGSVLASWTLLT
jgi:hypothetical protein